jgi:hypothetical protein
MTNDRGFNQWLRHHFDKALYPKRQFPKCTCHHPEDTGESTHAPDCDYTLEMAALWDVYQDAHGEDDSAEREERRERRRIKPGRPGYDPANERD